MGTDAELDTDLDTDLGRAGYGVVPVPRAGSDPRIGLQTLRRLRGLSRLLRGLRREEFGYDRWVGEFDAETGCGTVCCAAGWLPRADPANWAWCTGPSGSPEPSLGGRGHWPVTLSLAAYLPDMARGDVEAVFTSAERFFHHAGGTIGRPQVSAADVANLIDYWCAYGHTPPCYGLAHTPAA